MLLHPADQAGFWLPRPAVDMRSLTYEAPRRLTWRDIPAPALGGDREALVRPVACTTCDLDQWLIQGEFSAPPPFAIGHECVAEVLEIGDRVATVKPGDLVVVPWHISCGQCDRCRAGLPAHCRATPPSASYGLPFGGCWGGAFDEVLRVPYADAMLTVLPAGIDPITAVAAGDNLTIPVELLGRHLRRRPGAGVLILGRHGAGAGSVSLFAVATAAALGASRIVYVDPDPARRAIATALGADASPNIPEREAGRFDVLFDCSSSADALRAGLQRLEPEGIVECPGGHLHPVELDLFALYRRGVTFHTGLANAREHVHAAFDLIQQGRLDPHPVLAAPVPIDDAAEALVHPAIKPVFTRPQHEGSSRASPQTR